MYKIITALALFLAATLSVQAASFMSLPESYQTGHVLKILIVPGHDNEFSGSNADGMREAAVNLKLAGFLADELRKDAKLNITVSRDIATGEYIPELAEYFEENEDDVENFIEYHKKTFAKKQKKIEREQEKNDESAEDPKQVPHGNANEKVAYRLYAVNKWANEQMFDLVLHIHFNDTYPRGGANGQYGGYSIYVPGHGLQNEYPSNVVAGAIGSRLHDIVAKTNLGLEAELASDVGVIPDNKLIALGSYDTLKVPSVLVEYSYVYEPHVAFPFWDVTLSAMARATKLGLYDYLLDGRANVPTFAYTWNANLVPTTKIYKPEVVALQLALRNLEFYPPAGKTTTDCPVTGGYGLCTKSAVMEFQKSKKLDADGLIGPKTREVLNTIFSPIAVL